MIKTAKILDPLDLPIQDAQLIEASAGTGKTFTITILYLRLLLGLSNSTKFPLPLRVEDLLVVTFTEAAAAEIRARIRISIHDLRIACLRQHKISNPLFRDLLNKITDKQYAAKCLLLAERQMDKAAIFTIHSFCKRMLSFYALECGVLYEQELIENEYELRYQASVDFWRRYCYPLPDDIAKIVVTQWKGPKELLCSIDPYLQGEIPAIKSPPHQDETLELRHKKNIAHIITLKKKWYECAADIKIILNNSNIDRRKFNYSNQEKFFKKIDAWVQEKTLNYQLPAALKKFSQCFLAKQTKPNGIIPEHPLFVAIDNLLAKPLTINDIVLFHAITEVRKNIAIEKNRRSIFGFDDMLSCLEKALKNERCEELATTIRTRFPVAMIDEFQDTNFQQYHIFRCIWYKKPKSALLLIGDPKQSIYSFRGADIFTYMKARSEIKARYTLDINWRSASDMVNSINTLFTRIDRAFVFSEIPFLPIKAAEKSSSLRFELQGEIQPAMHFWLMDSKGCSTIDYQTFMAQQSAAQIRDLLKLGAQGKALLWRNEVSRPVTASDIAILVRTRQEAILVRNALNGFGISSVYLSNRNSVFNTLEAREILWLLQAILSPEKENILRRALSSSILGLTILDIDFLNQNESHWDAVVEEFIHYRECWQERGVMAMLRNLMRHRKIAENIISQSDGERRLTDLMHIIELLQEACIKLKSKSALIRWLIQRITAPDNNEINQQIRLENDKHFVQIITIYKSKGLEYPLVWLPFIANYYTQKNAFYHDRISLKPTLDLNQTRETLELAEAERLAEDLRLLYVALTRSVWHCSLGVAPLFKRRGEKRGKTDLHHSAIGHLIQQGEPKDATGLRMSLESLCNKYITLHIVPDLPDNSRLELIEPDSSRLKTRKITRLINDNWQVTSYSALQQYIQSNKKDLILQVGTDCDIKNYQQTEQEVMLTPHNFPRGTASGKFLHKLFESLDFTQSISASWIANMLQKNGYELHWQPVLNKWIEEVLKTKLINSSISLNQLSIKERQVEMEFYLPINELVYANELDLLMREHDSLSKTCPPLTFQQVHGMLTGVIDLVFRYDGRYYLLDYKSNWLGENSEAYTHDTMTEAMRLHRYDLQYQLYTLALHRYLGHRIVDYHYDTHFGEVIYLFLRGVNMQNPHSGIFTVRPTAVLIDSMNRLFTKIVKM